MHLYMHAHIHILQDAHIHMHTPRRIQTEDACMQLAVQILDTSRHLLSAVLPWTVAFLLRTFNTSCCCLYSSIQGSNCYNLHT